VIFSYQLPCPDRDCAFTKAFPAPTRNVNVLLADVGIEIQSERLSFEGTMDAQGQSYLNYVARNLAQGEKIRLRFAPAGTVEKRSSSSTSTSPGTIVVIGLGGLAVVAALVYPWWQRRNKKDPASEEPH
jgi:hypothetical protein